MRRLRTANELLHDRQALDARFEEDGYLFFRDVLDHDAVLQVRREMADLLVTRGYLRAGDAEPLWTGADMSAFNHYPVELAERRVWERFVAQPRIAAFFEHLLGEPAHWLPIAEYRAAQPHAFPGVRHQDGFHNPGIPFRTAWIPLMDVDERIGGITLAARVHHRGCLHDYNDPPQFDIPAEAIPEDAWHRADYHVGDVVVMHPFTPHVGGANTSDLVRMSIDVRFEAASAPRPVIGRVSAVGDASISIVPDDGGAPVTLAVDDSTWIRKWIGKGDIVPLSAVEEGERMMVFAREGRALVVRPPT